ncbi:ribonuclease H-like protein [Multifurca ochricompacta]|uniref:Ribonuclease H-like protein n=1 Tax=Multifurca ochricompacta TaxID=376703 RepID=A0AAD4MB58_9AGAM|nr:ribonuclease H-like protein [Multifurca ochricompacta]
MFNTHTHTFRGVPCPLKDTCNRSFCSFSHNTNAILKITQVPYHLTTTTTYLPPPVIPAKRSAQTDVELDLQNFPSSSRQPYHLNVERPTKLQRSGSANKLVVVPTASSSPTGVPVLAINAGQSKIPISTRQAMLKSLYDHFTVLYAAVLPQNPSLASEHALRQEQEIYERTAKLTYRNTVITSIASLKKRPLPTSLTHPSVGTAGDLAARLRESDALITLRLASPQLEPLLLTREEMRSWNYIIDIPAEWGPGGQSPSGDGHLFRCERCKTPYIVRSLDHDATIVNACTYHWGKPLYRLISGERTRTYTCCSLAADGHAEGCTRGPHVFYESEPPLLHARHPFSESPPMTPSALDVAALDCEMVYTTGGFRIARVSVVDARGKEVFDEFIKMDDGVEVVDLNTRFSGIHLEEYAARAVLPLESVRRALGQLIGADTILIGHALDNDLRALRLVHRRVVDTTALFPHSRGLPYRRALRDLTKEYLNRSIQEGGGSQGHSSVEDSIAALDLVKWFALNKKTKPTILMGVGTGGGGGGNGTNGGVATASKT